MKFDQASSQAHIHSTVVIDPSARISTGCSIGPYCVIGKNVRLGVGVIVQPHVVIEDNVTIGDATRIESFAVLGGWPQHASEREGRGSVIIGSQVFIGCRATVNRGTEERSTVVGDYSMIMEDVHVAHDVQLGNQVRLVNGTELAGHVTIGDHSTLYGQVGVQQWVRIGERAMIAGRSAVTKDVPPFTVAEGSKPIGLVGINTRLLRSEHIPREVISVLRSIFRSIVVDGVSPEDIRQKIGESIPACVEKFLDFLQQKTRCGIASLRREK